MAAVAHDVIEGWGKLGVRRHPSIAPARSGPSPTYEASTTVRGKAAMAGKALSWREDATVLCLHGDLGKVGSPDLQGVLDSVILLQPLRLVVDLGDVDHASEEAIRSISRCVVTVPVVLRGANEEIAGIIARVGRSHLIEPLPQDHGEPRA